MQSNTPKSGPKQTRRFSMIPRVRIGRSKLNRTSSSLFAITALSVFTLFTAGNFFVSADTVSDKPVPASLTTPETGSNDLADVTGVRAVKFTSAAGVEPCIQQIEYQLERLYITVHSPELTDQEPGRIRRLAQTALDCEAASMNVNGSLGLVLTDLAILGIEWNPETSVLNLNVVNNTQETAFDTTYAKDGQAIGFYIP